MTEDVEMEESDMLLLKSSEQKARFFHRDTGTCSDLFNRLYSLRNLASS